MLGGSGCAVSSLCLGTMTFGVETDESVAHQQLDLFIEAGGTMVDTADVYGDGRSEEIIGHWFASRSSDVTERVVLATKGRFAVDDSPNGAGLSARHLTRALDASLRRLGLEAVDLYQVHAYDPLTPLEETLRALDQFIRAGKVRYWGMSNFTGWQLTKAVHLARALNVAGPVTLQPQYSLLARETEWEIAPAAVDAGLGLLPWSPLGGGWLSGKYRGEGGGGGAGSTATEPGPSARTTNWLTCVNTSADPEKIDSLTLGGQPLGLPGSARAHRHAVVNVLAASLPRPGRARARAAGRRPRSSGPPTRRPPRTFRRTRRRSVRPAGTAAPRCGASRRAPLSAGGRVFRTCCP